MRSLARSFVTFAALVALPAAAWAAPTALPPVKRGLSAASATDRACHASARSGAGVAQTSYRAPMAGFVSVRGSAAHGNWDLAVFDARTRRAVTGSSAGFGSAEVAQTWVGAGQRLLVQGCRRRGGSSTFRVATTFVDAKPPAPATPSLVRVGTSKGGMLDRLESLGFDVTHNMRAGWADVVVPSAAKMKLLEETGLPFTVRSEDLRQDFASARRADARRVSAAGASPLPTGRESYRVYADYQAELAKIAGDHPGLVRPFVLGKSYQGREIQGIEVAKDVAAKDDGRPYYLLVALHHAREWPSAEIAMEFAHMIVNGFGKDKQITRLLTRERVVIVPIINPDGFVASRGTNPDPADTMFANGGGIKENSDPVVDGVNQNTGPMNDGIDDANEELGDAPNVPRVPGAPYVPYDWDTVEGVFTPFGGNLAYRRKNCDGGVPNGPNHEEQNFPCYYQYGVDPNRNYGYGWGGVGASSDPNTQSYRGTGQWSEPETQNVWKWSQVHNVSMLITLHNVAALVLRPPGQHTDGLSPDEGRMKELGDAMAGATGYTSQYGWQLYDTTGTTEDWTYGAQGAFGYTIEIGPPGGKFHMPYQTGVVDEWTGTGSHAGHGMREALLLAAESAANPGDHSVVAGRATPGATLRLKKTFDTLSSPVCTFAQGVFTSGSIVSPLDCVAPGDQRKMADKLEYTTVVPASGRYEWHVPPSTRPFVFRHVIPGGEIEEDPYETKTWEAEAADIHPDRGIEDPNNEAPESDFAAERRFTVTDAGTNVVVGLDWAVPAQDFDLKLYKVGAGGALEPAGEGSSGLSGSPGSSGNPNGVPEEITVTNAPAGDYLVRVIYYLTGADQSDDANDWTLTVNRFRKAPDKVETGREEYTLTCEAGGKVIESLKVYVERGQRVTANLCSRAGAPGGPGGGSGSGPGGGPGGQAVLGAKSGSGTLVISRRTVRLARSGYARIGVLCSGGACSGALSVTTARRYATAARKTAPLAVGAKRFALKAGERAVLSIRVNRRARRLIAKHRRVPVLAQAGGAAARLTVVAAGRRG